jgi:hypothetical protein
MVPSPYIDHQLIDERRREFRVEGERARLVWQARQAHRRIRFRLPRWPRKSAGRPRPAARPHGA